MFLAAGTLLMSPGARADATLPWMPDTMTRHEVEMLVDQAGMQLPITHWPLPAGAVRQALSDLPADLPAPLEAARIHVRSALEAANASQAWAVARGGPEGPSGFGDQATTGSAIGVRGSAFTLGPVAGQLGVRADAGEGQQKRLRFDQSALAVEKFGVQLDVFSHRNWWGPGWASSTILSDNALPYLGVGLQRASAKRSDDWWLSWAGPWTAEIFFARSDSESGDQGIQPLLVGTRITFRPASRLEIGVTRMIQYGGTGRPSSAADLLKVLTGSKTNVEYNSLNNDTANEIAGLDGRLSCGPSVRCAFYTQVMGEDRGKFFFKKDFGQLGAETWTADGRHRFFAEYTNTACQAFPPTGKILNCVYRNGAYPGGYTSGGRWLGAGFGPDSRVVTLGWLDAAQNQSLRLHVGYIGSRIGVFAPFAYAPGPDTSGRLLGASAQRTFHFGRFNVSPEAAVTHIKAFQDTRTDVRVGVSVSVPI